MGFSETIYQKARTTKAHVVLPESLDIRTLMAASMVMKLGIVEGIIFLGDPDRIRAAARDENIDISGIEIVDCIRDGRFEEYVFTFFELRKHKGITIQDAVKQMKDPLYFGAMMVRKGIAQGMVAGAVSSSAHLIRSALTIVGVKRGIKTASSCFVMIVPDASFGHEGQMIFADCATVPCPDAHQLADIALASAETGEKLVGLRPVVAMLSFSTKGSAKHESVDKVVEATRIVKEKRPDLVIDGDLQADAALIESVAQFKCPGSPVGGKANILIFPDLNSGNIAYKLVHRFAKAEAFGPILQGLAKPINDLSRGCSAEDIVNVIAITSVQALS